MSDLPHLKDAAEAAEAVKDALRAAGDRLSKADVPNAALWVPLSKRLRVDPARVERHQIHYDWMDEPVTSWRVTVFVAPDQKPVYPAYELLSEAEDYLSESFGDSFFLVPAILAGAEQH